MIDKYKINVAYDQILVYDRNIPFIKVNLLKYDVNSYYRINNLQLENFENEFNITFPYTLSADSPDLINKLVKLKIASVDMENFFSNEYNTFNNYTLEELYNSDKKFIYPVMLTNSDIFRKPILLDEKLVECIKDGRAKLCFFQLMEGFFGYPPGGAYRSDYLWLSELSNRYGLKKENIIMITANMNADKEYQKLLDDQHIKDNFTIFPYNHFQYNLFFHHYNSGNLLLPNTKSSIQQTFSMYLENNRNNKKKYHFLCFNRIVKAHRVALFSELMTNENFKDKFITSMGATTNGNRSNFFELIKSNVNDNYKHNKQRLLDFYEYYDSNKSYVYDEPDLQNNKAAVINRNAHETSFVNIITESLFQQENCIFFSEKTFKPIYACQPFILFGNPHSLKKLKELGFKTFDKWWNESYDDEYDFTKKLEKIVDVMIEISSWDMDKCFQITNDMESTLVHNFNNMIDTKYAKELFDLLGFYLHKPSKYL